MVMLLRIKNMVRLATRHKQFDRPVSRGRWARPLWERATIVLLQHEMRSYGDTIKIGSKIRFL